MPESRIERYRPEHRSRLLELQTHHWGADAAANESYFAWKYEQNPYLDEIPIYVALEGEELVGMRGAIGGRWIEPDGAPVPALPVGDLVVHPQHRARFIPRRIMEAMADDLTARGYRYLLNFSAGRFSHLVSLRQGWRLSVEHAAARQRPYPRSWWGLPARLSKAGFFHEPKAFGAFDRATQLRSRRRPAAISIERSSRPAEMADLCDRAERPVEGIRQERDERFLRWRFDNPFSRYRFLYWRAGSTLEAYLVLQHPPAGGRPILLVDWAFLSTETMERLVATAIEHAGVRGTMVWLGGCSDLEHAIFARAGFVQNSIPAGEPYRPGLLVKTLGPERPIRPPAPDASGPETWRYHAIDSDGF